MKRKVAMAMVAAMAVGSFTVPVFAEDAAAEGGKIGISMPTQSLERWNRDGSYLQKQFEDAGYEVELTYSDNETDRQVNDIQNLISDGVNLLVVAAIDGEALNTVMDEAAEAGIPVISYDRLIKSDAVSYYVSFDNYTVGTLQGQYVVDTLDLENAGDKTYNIEFTAGDPADNNAGYFFNGAFDVLKPYIDAGTLNVVSGQTDFDSVATPAWDTQSPFDIPLAIPRYKYIVANVVIIAGTLTFVITIPFNKPQAAPTTNVTKTPATEPPLTAVIPPSMDESTIMFPQERSIPPVIMIIVIGSAINPISIAFFSTTPIT